MPLAGRMYCRRFAEIGLKTVGESWHWGTRIGLCLCNPQSSMFSPDETGMIPAGWTIDLPRPLQFTVVGTGGVPVTKLPARLDKLPDSTAAVGAPVITCGDPLNHSVSLIIGKEEDFVALDGPAECAAELILVIGAALSRVEIIRGIEIGIAQEFEKVAVILVRAGFGDHVDKSAAVVAVFGVEIVGEYAKFSE